MRKTTRYLTGIGAIVLGAGILASCKELPPTTFATAASWTVGRQPGGLMLAGIAFRLLRIRDVPVGDMLPALIVAPLLTQLVIWLR